MKAITLFAGAGGSDIGLQLAGIDVELAVDFNEDAVATLVANGAPGVNADLFAFDWSPYAGKIDLIEGGPPCQPFSSAGKGQGEWDERDGIPAYLRAVREVQPTFFVLENVRGLTFKKHRDYLNRVVDELRALGYDVDFRVLNAANFGVPQTRERLFIIGRNDGGALCWPTPTHARDGKGGLRPWVTMAKALGWKGFAFGDVVASHGAVRADDKPSPTITSSIDNGNFRFVHPEWTRRRPSTTVAADPRIGRPGHKDRDKGESQLGKDSVRVTTEEAATLQDFPADWQFVGSRSSKFQQIGNACPPRLTAAVSGALTEAQCERAAA